MLNNVQLFYFSPTGGTKAYGELFCKSISQNFNGINLGLQNPVSDFQGELAIFALPVFAGRIPSVIAEKISTLNGNGKKAVTLVVYGTRAYEDALLELNDVVKASNFSVVASGAVVAQHSIVPVVGQGRPDKNDADSINNFAKKVLKKLEDNIENPVIVPGNFPYRNAVNFPFTPICLPNCKECGQCISICPTNAIQLDKKGLKTDVNSCILCMGCISACPNKARILPPPVQETMVEKMSAFLSTHKENEYFL